jgi:hypothetical protein
MQGHHNNTRSARALMAHGSPLSSALRQTASEKVVPMRRTVPNQKSTTLGANMKK